MNIRHVSFVRRTLSAVAATLVGSTLLAAPTLAVADDAVRIAVQFDDLDLAKEAGAAALYRRLAGAADRACGVADIRDLRPHASIRQCRREAIERAVAAVPSPAFAAWHARKTGRTDGIRVAQQR